MDALKLIPQVFFDLIGRVVPGAFLLVCLEVILPWPIIKELVTRIAPNELLQQSPVVWILILTSSSYVAGHFLGPFVRLLERTPTPPDPKPPAITQRERVAPEIAQPAAQAGAGQAEASQGAMAHVATDTQPKRPLPKRVVLAIRDTLLPFRKPGTKFDQNVWLQYDWLRLEQPEAGGLVARIRAEYTMFGGFAVALLVCLAVVVTRAVIEWATYSGNTLQYVQTASARSALGLTVVTALASLLMVHRHCDTYRTFGRGVQNFYLASRGCDRWKEVFQTPEKKG